MRAVAKLCSNYPPHQMQGAFRRGIVVACNIVPFGLKPGAGKPGLQCQEFLSHPPHPLRSTRARKPEMGVQEAPQGGPPDLARRPVIRVSRIVVRGECRSNYSCAPPEHAISMLDMCRCISFPLPLRASRINMLRDRIACPTAVGRARFRDP